jgi:hypothetical protein
MMKKILSSVIILTAMFLGANGQDTLMTSKRGIPILPNSGDWAIGIDARPFTKLFNNDSDMGYNFIHDNTLIGKKFINPNMAHRAKLRIAFNSITDDEYIIKDGQTVPDPTVTVTDTKQSNFTNITVGYGIEKRTGYGRLQVSYGAEILLSYESYNESYTYGNSFSMSNPNPSTFDFGTNILTPGRRLTFFEQGIELTTALRVFLGTEYFIAPKISVGGEFGWGVAYTNTSDGKWKFASWDAENDNVKSDMDLSGGISGFSFDNDNFGGAIFFMFHFK